ncbi:hypothetical protein C8R45DRAFT_930274 [Mycena sanguinolenta]|nr:hypothetical protein C8R45DRAFT_930274 [Mycena sanguinolenta]
MVGLVARGTYKLLAFRRLIPVGVYRVGLFTGDEDDKEGEDHKHPQSVVDVCPVCKDVPLCLPINVLEKTSDDDEPASKKYQTRTATGSTLREGQQLAAMAVQWVRKSEGEAIAVSDTLGLDLEELKRAFSNTLNWTSSIIATPAKAEVMPRDGTQRRSEVVKMIQNGLHKGFPLNSLSLLTIFGGGAGMIQTLWLRLHSGECGWEPVPEAIQATLIAKYSGTTQQATDIHSESTPAVAKKRKCVEADNIHDEMDMREGKAGKVRKRALEVEVEKVKKGIAKEPCHGEHKPKKSRKSNPANRRTISKCLLTYSPLVHREDGTRGSGGSGGSNGKTAHSSSSMKPVSSPPIRTMTEGSNSDSSDDSDG